MSTLTMKLHEFLLSSFRGVVLTKLFRYCIYFVQKEHTPPPSFLDMAKTELLAQVDFPILCT